MKLKVGVDIDGVITSPYSWLEGFNKLYHKELEPKDCTNYNLQELFQVSTEEWNRNKDKHLKIFHKQYKIRENNKEWLELLSNYVELYFITAREPNFNSIKSVKAILKEVGIQFSTKEFNQYVVFTKDKVKACEDLGINFMVEDSPYETNYLANNNVQVILLYAEYNKHFKCKGNNPNANSNVYRRFTCNDVMKYLIRMSKSLNRIEDSLDDIWGNCPKTLGLKNYCGSSESCYECWCKATKRYNMA